MDRFLRDKILALEPLHPNQHAYQAGKSVETLHQLVVRVEKNLDRQEIDLGVFLDMEGAFDNTSYDSMCSALTRHGVDQTIIRWIRATLEGKLATAAFKAISRSVAVTRGCPREGLSPILWSMRRAFINMDMRMTSVFQRWEDSQTRYHCSYSGPCIPLNCGVASLVCRLIPTRPGL